MVCIYCGTLGTFVANSRLQKSSNNIWRRRRCPNCSTTFTTNEYANLQQSLIVKSDNNPLPKKFNRDQLFIDIFSCLKHRENALEEAGALTQTIINQVTTLAREATINRQDLVNISQQVLKRFDNTAAVIYEANFNQ